MNALGNHRGTGMHWNITLLWLAVLIPLTAATTASLHPVLNQVLNHYSEADDSLKRKAATFLFENMEGHSYMTFDLADTAGTVVAFDVLDYATFADLESSFKTLENTRGTLDFQKRAVTMDDSVITAEFVIDHVDRAMAAWRSRPWARDFSFAEFCEYILPYRGSNEPLELWREFFASRYDSAFNLMADPADPIEAASLINRDLMSWFHFDPRFYYHPTDQGLADMRSTTLGRCEDMTNLTIYAMRANGLAVTSDYTPYWANSGNNHAWNAIVTADGKVIPFMGAEANPGSYQLANKLAKVYRKTYSVQRDNLAFQVAIPEDLPKYLSSKSYTDVTRDYTTVRDVTLDFAAPDSITIGYLCVFNSGEWKAIHWSRLQNGAAVFSDMGVGIAYLPACFSDGKIVPVGAPFILAEDGSVHPTIADTTNLIRMELTSTTKTTLEMSTDGIRKTNFLPDVVYELKFWRDGWQTLGTVAAGDKPIVFDNVPSAAIYWLTSADSDREERIFTYENNQQVWW